MVKVARRLAQTSKAQWRTIQRIVRSTHRAKLSQEGPLKMYVLWCEMPLQQEPQGGWTTTEVQQSQGASMRTQAMLLQRFHDDMHTQQLKRGLLWVNFGSRYRIIMAPQTG